MLEILIYVLTGLFVVLVPVIYWIRERKKSREASAILARNIELGMDEPTSLHPEIDPDSCIGTRACVMACPEERVLDVVNGKGTLVNPTRCIGHGLCQAACPVDAISLVFGTEKRGVDIPHMKGTFESNVEGVFIAGELGGMGLIRNTISQGAQAIENIQKQLEQEKQEELELDLIIIGAGPAGIGAALKARELGIRFLILDQYGLGGSILHYPRQKLVMTQPMYLPLEGKINFREIEKEPLLKFFNEICEKYKIDILTGEKVEAIERINHHFQIITGKNRYESKKILLAIGRRGSPRKLGVPGEKSAKTAYHLLDPERYTDQNILVVGGGDSAVEAAVVLSEQHGNRVHLSYRRERIFRIKDKNAEKLQTAINSGKIKPLFGSEVQEIRDDSVVLKQGDQVITLPNDQVFVMIGGELPMEFLTRAGVQFSRKFGER